jgi:mono/diheme cytochrome c family protein
MPRPGSILLRSVVAASALAAMLAACGPSRRVDPPIGQPGGVQDPQLVLGRQVFMRACHQCHPRGEAGLGPAVNNMHVPAFLIRMQIRLGLGAMPAFPRSALSAEELEAVVRYIQFMQDDVPAPPA